MKRRERWEMTLGAFVLATAGVLIFLAVRLGGLGAEERITVTVLFKDAAGLVRDGDVTIAGVKVGSVAELAVEQGQAKAILHLRRNAGVRVRDAAVIRMRSLLGDKYIEIQPGDPSAPLLTDGGRLEMGTGTVEIDRFLARLEPLVDELQPQDEAASPVATTLKHVDKLATLLENALEGRDQDLSAAIRTLRQLTENMEQSGAMEPQKMKDMARELTEAMAGLDSLLSRQRANLDLISANLAAISQPLAGAAPNLIGNADRLLETLAPLAGEAKQASARLKSLNQRLDDLLGRWEKITGDLEAGKGTAGKLLKDDALYQESLGLVKELRAHPWRLLRKGKPPEEKPAAAQP